MRTPSRHVGSLRGFPNSDCDSTTSLPQNTNNEPSQDRCPFGHAVTVSSAPREGLSPRKLKHAARSEEAATISFIMTQIDQLIELVRLAPTTVAFTGAGISTESGIPDFRSPGGVWSKNKPVLYDDFLRSRDARVQYWKMRRELYEGFAAAKPNAGHTALAKLEASGKLAGIITQNIDGLHQDAGSRLVIELHGTARIVACVECGKEWPPEVIVQRMEQGEDAPDCDACEGPLKSKTISFGQAMPEQEMNDAARLAQDADLFLAIGSSLVVEPAASLPRMAKSMGATLVILNNTPTPLDELADLIIHEPIGGVLQRVFEAMD